MTAFAKCAPIRRTAVAFILTLLWSASDLSAQQNRSLADVLEENSIADPPSSIPNLQKPISSYETLNDDQDFLIAYYLVTPDNLLQFPLFLTRLDKRSGKWQHVSLADLKVNVSQGAGSQKTDCIGSVLRIKRKRAWYYLDLHWTPSAGCLLILNHDLTVSHMLPGWTAGFFESGLLVYMENMVHFADTHPEKLFVYDPANHASLQLYPPKNDAFRKDFGSRLRNAIDLNKCRKNNWACQPERFTTDIGAIQINDSTSSLAFAATFETEGFLTQDEAERSGAWDDDQYVYFYQLKPLRWRGFSAFDLNSKFGTGSLNELLGAEKLHQVFATPPN